MKKNVSLFLNIIILLPLVGVAQSINWSTRKNVITTNYVGIVDWNNTKWFWTENGQRSFFMRLQASGYTTKITYATFDNSLWTAHRHLNQLIHAPNDDQSRAHVDAQINYINWSGYNQSAWFHAYSGTWSSVPDLNDGGLHDLPFINLYGADGNKWTVTVVGDSYLIAKGVQGPLWQQLSVLNFIGWDGKKWSAQVLPGRNFKVYNASTNNITKEILLLSSEGQHLAVKFNNTDQFVVTTDDPRTIPQLPSNNLTLNQPPIDPSHPPNIPRPARPPVHHR